MLIVASLSRSETTKIAGEQKAAYREMVESTAQGIVDKLTGDNADQRGRWKNLFTTFLHEYTGDHEAHTDPDKAVLTLMYSDNPCSGFGQGAGEKRDKDTLQSKRHDDKDQFPFSSFAADAFEDDVKDAALTILRDEHDVNIDADEFDTGETDDDGDDEGEEEVTLDIRYRCPTCAHTWEEQYSSACDSECPKCQTENITSLQYKEEDEEWTEEQNAEWVKEGGTVEE